MGEYMFGVTPRKLSARAVARRDRLCRQHGGYGYQQVDESHGTAEGGRWVGWYSGPNRGAPFDGMLATKVLAAVKAAEEAQ